MQMSTRDFFNTNINFKPSQTSETLEIPETSETPKTPETYFTTSPFSFIFSFIRSFPFFKIILYTFLTSRGSE